MATPTLTLLNHQLLTTADANTGWNDLTTADTDIKVEGQNSMSGIFRSDGEQGYYDSGTAPVTAAGKTFRGWILTNNLPYMGTFAGDPFKLLAYDGTTTELKALFGSDTYPGGWFNIIWNMDDFTTLTLANVRRWGVESGHASNAKNVVNTWMDVMRYADGYYVTGGTTSDRVRLADVVAVDKPSALWIVSQTNEVFFATGTLQIGNGATTTFFEMSGQILIFVEYPVRDGLYVIRPQGTGCTVKIVNSVIRSTGTSANTRVDIDLDDADYTLEEFTGNLIVRGGTLTAASGQDLQNNTFDDCQTILANGADFTGSQVKNYSGTANTSSLIWNVATNPSGLLDDMQFTMGSTDSHAIEFGTTSPTTLSLNGIDFSGYGTSNNANDSMLHIKRDTGTVTINLSGVTIDGGAGTVTYRTDGATVVLVSSNTLELTGLKNPTEVRVFDAGTTTAVAGQENVTTGTFSTSIDSATYPSVDISIIALGYQNLRLLNISMSTDRSIPVSQVLDRQYLNP